MPVRRFNGTSDYLRTSIGACNISTAVTMAALVRIETDGAQRTFFQLHNSGGEGTGYDIYREASNKLSMYNGSGAVQESSLELKAADGWLLVVITKAAGAVKPKYYRYKFSTSAFSAAEGGANYADGKTVASGTVRFGEFQESLRHKGDIAACGIWNEALSEAQVKSLHEAASLEAWKAIGTPKGMWFFNQAAVTTEVTDQMGGGANQSARSGTTVVEEEPPIPFTAPTTLTVNAPPAIAVASAPAPTPHISLSPPAATATAVAPAPTPSIQLEPPAAVATASAPSPAVGPVLVISPPPAIAIAVVAAPIPAIQISPPAATAVASAPAPLLEASAPSRIAVTQEYPPDKLAWRIEPPKGAPSRWAADEPLAENVIDDMRWVGEMPGGWKEASGVLGRNPREQFPDLAPFSDVTIYGPGVDVVGSYRIDKTPKSDGDRIVISPAVVGWQKALDDDNSVIGLGYINRDLGGWSEPSVSRRVAIAGSSALGSFSASPDDSGAAGLVAEVPPAPFTKPRVEAWFDGGGARIAAVQLKATLTTFGLPDASLSHDVGAASDDVGTGLSTQDLKAANGIRQLVTFAEAGRYARLAISWTGSGGGSAGATYGARWQDVAVIADHGLPLQGEAPDIGFTVSQMLGHAVSNHTALEARDEDLEDSGYIVQHAWFTDAGPISRVVQELTKYELLDWFVFDGRRFQLRMPGTYGRRWQAYSGPSRLEEDGEDASRLWREITVQWQDVSGRTYTVGPPGSGATVEDAALEVTDPNHPAVRAELTRKDLLTLHGISTSARATEAGEIWLREANLLSRSGRCSLSGYVMDDRGVFHPASKVQPGDHIRIPDAGSDTSYRKIVGLSYDHTTRTVDLDLDAPPEATEALLERMDAAIQRLGIS